MNMQQRSAGIAAFFLYTLIVLEFLYMITPFLAFSYYAAYGQFLGVLNHSPWSAWLTTFFLPHFSQTGVEWLQRLPGWGRVLGLIGLVGFVITAGQIYWSKLTQRGVVKGGIYSVVRHPQYAFLMMLGFAALLIWPRFIVLYAFAIMVFLYVVLARHEEAICSDKFGESYDEYLRKTGMFFPRLLSASAKATPRLTLPGAAALFGVVIVGASLIGFGLREFSLGAISAVYREREAIVSVAALPDVEISAIVDAAAADENVQALRRSAPEGAQWIIYVVPDEWYMPDLPIDPLEYVADHGGHGAPRGYDRTKWQVLFTTARTWDRQATGREIAAHAFGKTPVVLANVDLSTSAVTQIVTPPPHVVWGDIPMPTF